MSVVVAAGHRNGLSTFYEAETHTAALMLAEQLLDGSYQADLESPVVKSWVLDPVEAENIKRLNAVVQEKKDG